MPAPSLSTGSAFQRPSLGAGIVLVLALGLSACVATAPDWESTFGDAVRAERLAQTLDPQAASRNTELRGADGRLAAGAMRQYRETVGDGVKESKTPVPLLLPSAGQSGR